ncbi:MAG: hypothetical protein IT262_08075 [Saprospiraceae bacterium]|nr:hypothetical protein [Saprospiraceae bacterium]
MISKRKFSNKYRFIVLLLLLAGYNTLAAQPLWSTKQQVGERVVFKDDKVRNKYYYGPGKLFLSTDRDGKPVFQLIAMRYTGTGLAGTKGEKRFTNLLQFSVSMKPVSTAELESLRKELKLPASAQLSPLPIRHLESVIVSGVGRPGADDSGRIRKQTGSQDQGDTAPGVYWTERTFTVPLENHEAQILWDQQVNGRVAISLNYAFYANVLQYDAQDIKITGDSALVENLKGGIGEITQDTVLSSEIVSGDVLNIVVDAEKYPDVFKKIDINENSIPPAYAALEVKCFDFSLDVRPDLAFKSVEIEGTSVTGQPVLVKTKFSQKLPDVTNKFVSFPYALRMDRPLRYRVVEVPYDGDRYQGAWMQIESGANLVDATTPQKENPVDKFCLDIEITPEYMEENAVLEASVHFLFQYEGRERTQTLSLSQAEGVWFKNICVIYDKEKPLRYFITKKYKDGRTGKGFIRGMPKDGYVLISN